MKQLMQLLSSLLILVILKGICIEGSAVYKDLLHSIKGKLLTKSHYIVGRALTYGVIRIRKLEQDRQHNSQRKKEGEAVSAPLVEPIVLRLLQTRAEVMDVLRKGNKQNL